MSAAGRPPKNPSGMILYRHFDASDQLLYVGITSNFLSRQGTHEEAASWFDDIAYVTTERYQAYADAAEAEKTAIKTERPLHNRQHASPFKERAARERLERIAARDERSRRLFHEWLEARTLPRATVHLAPG